MAKSEDVARELLSIADKGAKAHARYPTGIEPGYDPSTGITWTEDGRARYRKQATGVSAAFLRQISLSVTANTWTRVPWRTADDVLTGTNFTEVVSGGDILSLHPGGFSGASAFIYAAHAGFCWAADAGWRHLAIMEDDGGSPPSKTIKAATSLLHDGTTVVAQNVSCLIYHSADIRYSVWVLSDTNTSLSTGDIGGWGEPGETFFHFMHVGTVT